MFAVFQTILDPVLGSINVISCHGLVGWARVLTILDVVVQRMCKGLCITTAYDTLRLGIQHLDKNGRILRDFMFFLSFLLHA